MTIMDFTPVSGFVGGLFIGVSATLLLWLKGETAGVSSIVYGTLRRPGKASTRDWLFLIGLIGGTGWGLGGLCPGPGIAGIAQGYGKRWYSPSAWPGACWPFVFSGAEATVAFSKSIAPLA